MSRNPTPHLDQIRALREARFAQMEARQKEAEKTAAPEKSSQKAASAPTGDPGDAPMEARSSPAKKTKAKAAKPMAAKKERPAKKAPASKTKKKSSR